MTLLCGQSSNLMLSLLDLLNSISHMDDIQDVSAQSDLSASGGGSSDRSDPARLPTWVVVVSLFVLYNS